MVKYGLIGVAGIGEGMIKNLLATGVDVIVWDESKDAAAQVVEAGAELEVTAADVVRAADVTFVVSSNEEAARSLAAEGSDVLAALKPGKGYVECAEISEACAKDIAAAISAKEGRFLEAPATGSVRAAENGTLMFLCSGDKALFDENHQAFTAMGQNAMC